MSQPQFKEGVLCSLDILVGNEKHLLIILHGAISKALALQSERFRFNPLSIEIFFGYFNKCSFYTFYNFVMVLPGVTGSSFLKIFLQKCLE